MVLGIDGLRLGLQGMALISGITKLLRVQGFLNNMSFMIYLKDWMCYAKA